MWPFKKYLPDDVVIERLAELKEAYTFGIISNLQYEKELSQLFKKASYELLYCLADE